MMRKLAEWASGHGQTAKIRPSDGYGRIRLPLEVPCWYHFHEFGGYLGDLSCISPADDNREAGGFR